MYNRTAILAGNIKQFSFSFDGENHLRNAVAEGRGVLLLTAHVGNWEAAGALLSRLDVPVNVTGFDNESAEVRSLLNQASKAKFRLLPLTGSPTDVIPLVAAGIAVQLLAVTVGGLDFLMLLRSSEARREVVWLGGRDRVDLADVWFNPNYSQIEGNWILLRCLLHIPPKPGRPEDAGKQGTPLYDTMPAEDWNAAAGWDFIWNLRRSSSKGRSAAPVQ